MGLPGPGPNDVVIAETTANLASHLGHRVEITAAAITAKDKTHVTIDPAAQLGRNAAQQRGTAFDETV